MLEFIDLSKTDFNELDEKEQLIVKNATLPVVLKDIDLNISKIFPGLEKVFSNEEILKKVHPKLLEILKAKRIISEKDLSELVQECISLFNKKEKNLSEDTLLEWIKKVSLMNENELIELYSWCKRSATTKNQFQTLGSVYIISRLKDFFPGIIPSSPIIGIIPNDLILAKMNKNYFVFEKVVADLGVKTRELIELQKPIEGNYTRSVKNEKVKINSKCIGVLYTYRLMKIPFISSFEITYLNEKDKQYFRKETIPISEQNFKTSLNNYIELFKQIEKISEQQTSTKIIAVRDFFLKSLIKGNIFTDLTTISFNKKKPLLQRKDTQKL